ncbi:MAG: glycosyl transferase family 1 [Bacteroidetes bacterium]|nr:glycosyl transferase family 1 [Bacteroidota bacterium]
MKRVLIITYYWPPCGGAGVQRWLKFVKYLPHYGWEPVVYTPSNPEMPSVDESLAREIPATAIVIKQPIREPYNIYKKLVGRKKSDTINPAFLSENRTPPLTEKISVWIRGNFFIPDARKSWISPSIRYLVNYLKIEPVDAIISTGPPHSMHLIGLGLKERTGVPWIADFRDLWTKNDYHDQLMLTAYARKKHYVLEQKVLSGADLCLTIGNTMKKDLIESGAVCAEVITNGFDEEDLLCKDVEMDRKFSIAHIGTLVKTRNPETLWKILSQLVKENKEFSDSLEIKLIGKLDISVTDSIAKNGLNEFVRRINYLPHREVMEEMQKSRVLLLLINRTGNATGILTGKFFEYLATGRPILLIGPVEGDASAILKETGSGVTCDFDDAPSLRKIILNLFDLYKNNRLIGNSEKIGKYSRKELTKQLTGIMTRISGRN